jgi:hypothetical protein
VFHEILRVIINLLDENVFQNPQIFRKTLRLFPEQSTLQNTMIPCHSPIVYESTGPDHSKNARHGARWGTVVRLCD